MTDADRKDFAALMSQALAFYRQDVSAFALGVWWQACAPFDMEQVRRALTAHAMDAERGQFAPKPADIVRQLQGTHTDRSLVAWGRVLEAMQRVGAYRSVDFGDQATHQAIADAGGWAVLCRSSIDELPFVQRRFCEAHRTYTKHGAPDAPLRLHGEHEAANALKGYPVAAAVALGRAKPALQQIGADE